MVGNAVVLVGEDGLLVLVVFFSLERLGEFILEQFVIHKSNRNQ